jgi:hypothetical protein
MECQSFFAEHKGDKELCKKLMLMGEAELLAWENETASVFSPGVVEDSEILYQQILDPTNLDEAKTGLHPMAFDTATGVGMSTNRFSYTTVDRLIASGNARANSFNEKNPTAKQRALWGFVPLRVSLIRSIISTYTGTRGLFVFDTALADDPSHADICQGVKEPKAVRGVRFELYNMVRASVLRLDDLTAE